MKDFIQKIRLIILIITLGCLVILSSCGESKKEEKKQMEKVKRKTEIVKRITEMAKIYNAVIDWEKDLRPKNFLRNVFTVEVQRALVRENNRPVLFIAGVQDIEKRGDEYIVYFDRWAGYYSINLESLEANLPILFIIKCTEEQAQRILNQPNEILFENYSVIASISDVHKMRFSLTPYSLGEHEANIEIDSSEVFIAKGNCLDLLFIGDFGVSEFWNTVKETLMEFKPKEVEK
ncbi:MAG: hypothetical protein U9O50_08380 [Acidobacteriota bacterium]|nr:hypothetical protein [Acidobacteriota bacterium]